MIHPEYRLGDGTSLVGSADAYHGYSQWYGAEHVAQALRQALSILKKIPRGSSTDIMEDRITLAAAVAFLHNPPPSADLSQIRNGPSRPAAVSGKS